jgi:PAS domain S-box-containing protein
MSASQLSGEVALAVLASLPDAFLLMDGAGRVQYLNPAAAELLDHPAGELVGASVTDFIVAQPGQRIEPVAWLARWAAEPASPQLRYLTLSGRTRSGALLRLAVRVARLDEKPQCYVVAFRDVTAQQRAHRCVPARQRAVADDGRARRDSGSDEGRSGDSARSVDHEGVHRQSPDVQCATA